MLRKNNFNSESKNKVENIFFTKKTRTGIFENFVIVPLPETDHWQKILGLRQKLIKDIRLSDNNSVETFLYKLSF